MSSSIGFANEGYMYPADKFINGNNKIWDEYVIDNMPAMLVTTTTAYDVSLNTAVGYTFFCRVLIRHEDLADHALTFTSKHYIRILTNSLDSSKNNVFPIIYCTMNDANDKYYFMDISLNLEMKPDTWYFIALTAQNNSESKAIYYLGKKGEATLQKVHEINSITDASYNFTENKHVNIFGREPNGTYSSKMLLHEIGALTGVKSDSEVESLFLHKYFVGERFSGGMTNDGYGNALHAKLFRAFNGIEQYDLSGVDTSEITNMTKFFRFDNYANIKASNNLDLSKWNTANVSSMYYTFSNSTLDQNIGSWNVSKVSSMSGIFNDSSFNQDIGGWNVTKVTDVYGAFQYSSFNQDIGSWDISNANMTYMFQDSSFNQDLRFFTWDMNTAIAYDDMLDNIDPANHWMTDASTAFLGAEKDYIGSSIFQTDAEFQLALTTWVDNSSAADLSYGNITTWNTALVTDMSYAFNRTAKAYASIDGSQNLTSFDENIAGWNTGNVTNIARMFEYCSEFDQDIGSWNVSKVTDMTATFRYCSKFDQDIGSWNVSKVTKFANIFSQALLFNRDIGGWNVGECENFEFVFNACSSFNQNIASWNLQSATTIKGLFKGASAFNHNISSWNVSGVTSTIRTFENTQFNQDISLWNMAEVITMEYMFLSSSFNQDIGEWNVSAVTDMDGMFKDSSFNQDLRDFTWDISSGASTINMLDNIHPDNHWMTDASYVFSGAEKDYIGSEI